MYQVQKRNGKNIDFDLKKIADAVKIILRGVEQVEDSLFAKATLCSGHTVMSVVTNHIANAATFRDGIAIIGNAKRGCVDRFRHGAHSCIGIGLNRRHCPLELSHRVFSGIYNTRARQDIVEMIEEDMAPCRPECLRKAFTSHKMRLGGKSLALLHPCLRNAV